MYLASFLEIGVISDVRNVLALLLDSKACPAGKVSRKVK